MLDVEKNDLALLILGEERVRLLLREFPDEPIYAHAVYHRLQLRIIDEGLKNNDKMKDIAARAGVDRSTVYRRRDLFLGRKSKKH